MQRKLMSQDANRLTREIDERREDVAFLQQQLRTMEGKINEMSMTVEKTIGYTEEVKRLMMALAHSCETSRKGLEQEVHEREQAIQEEANIRQEVTREMSASIQELMEKASTTLQDVRYANARSNSGRDENLESFKELVQKEVEALRRRTGNHWEHYDAMFAQLNHDVTAAKSETALASQTLVGHTAAIDHIGKLLCSCSEQVAGNASRIAQFIASGETSAKTSPEMKHGEAHIEENAALLNARMDEIQAKLEQTQASVEAEVSQTKVTFDIHRQELASVSQRVDSLKDFSTNVNKSIYRCYGMSDDTDASRQCINGKNTEEEDERNDFKLRAMRTATSPPRLLSSASASKLLRPQSPPVSSRSISRPISTRLSAPASPTLRSRPMDGEEEARQKFLRFVPVQHRKTLAEHESTQPWLEKSWEERLKLTQQLLPSLMESDYAPRQ